MKKLLLAALLLVPADALAQFSTRAEQEYSHALTAAGRFGTPRYTTALLPSCSTANLGALAYDTTVSGLKICNGSAYVVAATQTGVGIFASSPTVTSLGLTTGTFTAESTGVLRTATSSYAWTNAMVAALGANTTGDITAITLPAKTVVENAYVVIRTSGATGKKATGTITLTGAPLKGLQAVGTITMSGVATAGQTFTVHTQPFTWVASGNNTGDVVIGGSAAEACTNIIYSLTRDVQAHAIPTQGSGTTVVVTSPSIGTAGNSVVFANVDSANMAFDGSGTLGGTVLGRAPDRITVGGTSFSFVTLRAAGGQITAAGTAAGSVTNIVTAITADVATLVASDGTGDVVDLIAVTAGTGGNALSLSEEVDGGNVIALSGSGTLTGGEDLSTLTVSCGRTGAAYIDWIVASNAKAAANTIYGDGAAERGALLGFDLPSYTGTTVVKCQFISTGTNLANVVSSTGALVLTTTLLP